MEKNMGMYFYVENKKIFRTFCKHQTQEARIHCICFVLRMSVRILSRKVSLKGAEYVYSKLWSQTLRKWGVYNKLCSEKAQPEKTWEISIFLFSSKETASQLMYKVIYPANIYRITLFDVQRLTIQDRFTQRILQSNRAKGGEPQKNIY